MLFLSISAAAQTVDENSDIVEWNDVTFIIPLKKKDENGKRVDQWTLNILAGQRFGRNLKRGIDTRGAFTLNYRFNKNWTAGTGYLYRTFRPTEARRQFESRLMFFAIAEKKWTKATFRNRFLTTVLLKNSNPDTVVYRNRAQLNIPLKKKEREIVTPYFSDEPFYDFRIKKWFRNDFNAGISKQFTPKFGADFYYLHQSFSTGAIHQTNGFGISLRVRIDKVK